MKSWTTAQLALGATALLFLLSSPTTAQVAASAQGYNAFRLVRTRNIFEPDRQGPPRSDEAPRPQSTTARSNFIVLTGTMVTASRTLAFFTGSRPEYAKVIPVGEKIADFTLTSITPAQVELEHAGKRIEVAVGGPIPLEGTSAAGVTSEPLPAGVSPPPGAAAVTTNAQPPGAAVTTNPAPAPAGDKAEVLRRMMERRQKEMSP